MNFNEYQDAAFKFCRDHNDAKLQIINSALGLTGETGEVIDELKKFLFHDHHMDTIKLISELGDVLWYLSNVATLFGVTMDDVAQHNIDKLSERYPSGEFKSEDSMNRKEGE